MVHNSNTAVRVTFLETLLHTLKWQFHIEQKFKTINSYKTKIVYELKHLNVSITFSNIKNISQKNLKKKVFKVMIFSWNLFLLQNTYNQQTASTISFQNLCLIS